MHELMGHHAVGTQEVGTVKAPCNCAGLLALAACTAKAGPFEGSSFKDIRNCVVRRKAGCAPWWQGGVMVALRTTNFVPRTLLLQAWLTKGVQAVQHLWDGEGVMAKAALRAQLR